MEEKILMGKSYWDRKRFKWEISQEIYVFGMNGINQNEIKKSIEIMKETLKEFNLPLKVSNGNSNKPYDLFIIERIFRKCIINNRSVDYEKMENEIDKLREKGQLSYGIIILADHNSYEIKNLPNEKEPAIYGKAYPDGFALILRFDLDNAIRHELGHMIGLGVHHEHCVMERMCIHSNFCKKCNEDVKRIWKLQSLPNKA